MKKQTITQMLIIILAILGVGFGAGTEAMSQNINYEYIYDDAGNRVEVNAGVPCVGLDCICSEAVAAGLALELRIRPNQSNCGNGKYRVSHRFIPRELRKCYKYNVVMINNVIAKVKK